MTNYEGYRMEIEGGDIVAGDLNNTHSNYNLQTIDKQIKQIKLKLKGKYGKHIFNPSTLHSKLNKLKQLRKALVRELRVK